MRLAQSCVLRPACSAVTVSHVQCHSEGGASAMGLCATLMIYGVLVEDVLCNTQIHLGTSSVCGNLCRCGTSRCSCLGVEPVSCLGVEPASCLGVPQRPQRTTQQSKGSAQQSRLVPDGVLWLAPVCTTWGCLSSSRCMCDASNGYEGDPSCTKVVAGNGLAHDRGRDGHLGRSSRRGMPLHCVAPDAWASASSASLCFWGRL